MRAPARRPDPPARSAAERGDGAGEVVQAGHVPRRPHGDVHLIGDDDVEITAVDGADKLPLLRSLGAAQVLDYRQVDFTRDGQRYDRILDVKTTRSVLACARALRPGGSYVTVGGDMARLFQALLLWPWIAMTSKRIRLLALKVNEGLAEVTALFEAGRVLPVIDRTYPLAEVPDAFRHYGTARHLGKVVITLIE